MFKKQKFVDDSVVHDTKLLPVFQQIDTDIAADLEYTLVDAGVSCRDLFEDALELSRIEYANTTEVLGVLLPGSGGKQRLYRELVNDFDGVVCYRPTTSDHRALTTHDTYPICENFVATSTCTVKYGEKTPFPTGGGLKKLNLFLQGGSCNIVSCRDYGYIAPRCNKDFFIRVLDANSKTLFSGTVREGSVYTTTEGTDEDVVYIMIYNTSGVLIQHLGFRVSGLYLHQILGANKVVGWESYATSSNSIATASVHYRVEFVAPSNTFAVKAFTDFGYFYYENGSFRAGDDVSLGINRVAEYPRDKILAKTQIIHSGCCIWLQTWCDPEDDTPTPAPTQTPMPTPLPVCAPGDNLITNGSFEMNLVAVGQSKEFSLSEVPGWSTFDGGPLKLYNNVNGVSAVDGENYAELDDNVNAVENIYQYVPTVKDYFYTLSFSMRARDPTKADTEDEGIVVSFSIR